MGLHGCWSVHAAAKTTSCQRGSDRKEVSSVEKVTRRSGDQDTNGGSWTGNYSFEGLPVVLLAQLAS